MEYLYTFPSLTDEEIQVISQGCQHHPMSGNDVYILTGWPKTYEIVLLKIN